MPRVAQVLLVLSLTAGTADAQRAPDMATLDRGDGISKVALDAGLTFLDDNAYDHALRLEIYGQYVAHSGLGLYGSLPLAMSFGAPGDDEDPTDVIPNDATSLANLELGGLYVVSQSSHLSFVFRGGVSIPTASDGRNARETLEASLWPRATDAVNAARDWGLRLGFSPLFYSNRLFLRADLGLDVALIALRFNVGVGVDLGPVALSFDSVNTAVYTPDDDDNPGGTEFLDELALAVRFMGEKLQPYVAVGVPLDRRTRDDVDLFIAGGVQFVP